MSTSLRPSVIRTLANALPAIAARSTCNRKKVAAIILDRRERVIATGYNGSLPGAGHCTELGCDVVFSVPDIIHMPGGAKEVKEFSPHCERTVHAEMNAILAIRSSEDIWACISTCTPCWPCFKHLVTSGVKVFFFEESYNPDPRIREYLSGAGLGEIFFREIP